MTLEQFREHTKNLPGSAVVDLCIAGNIIDVHEIIIFEFAPEEYCVELFDETACKEARRISELFGIEPIRLASEATL